MRQVDIVGDIHGQSNELENLLIKMGYELFKQGYRHPNRQLIMVGDLIDGTGSLDGQRRVLEIAQSMVANGDAQVIMGNHEFNAICYATQMDDGNYARPHNEKNYNQHKLFLDAFSFGCDDYVKAIEFFKSMPLWLETPEYRVVHACWNDEAQDRLREYLDDHNCLKSDELIKRFGLEEQPIYDDLELILKGPEIKLPQGVSFQDKYGHTRTNTRVRWWYAGDEPAQSIAIDETLQQQHDLSETYQLASSFHYNSEKPVFFGHYWMPPESFAREADNRPAVCLDYSVARTGGELVAIRLNETLETSEWFREPRV